MVRTDMVDITVTMFFTDEFVNVQEAMERARRRALWKVGAYIRTRAWGRMRRRKRASKPGHYPSVHSGLIKNAIMFAYDSQSQSVVVGPLLRGPGGAHELEYGGYIAVGLWKKKKVRIEARPGMRLALGEEMQNKKLEEAWRDVFA